jgi:hypothetical protein
LVDIVTESPPAKPEPVLTFAWLHSSELPDVVMLATVCGVSCKDRKRLFIAVGEVRMPLTKGTKEPPKPGCDNNSKDMRHLL